MNRANTFRRLLLASAFLASTQGWSLPAFPGALGYADSVTGGRAGTVVHVTNLNDAGTGSFRDAVSKANRIVVFDVGGYVHLKTAVSISSNITVAGQTAPGGGIGFRGGELSCAKQSNILLRYLRIRPGSETASSEDDALSLYLADKVMIDHCSIEFAPWNNIDGVGTSSDTVDNITFQHCLIADPIGQQFGAHCESVGANWAWYYNAFVNSHNRNPLAKTNTVFVNNVEYDNEASYTTHTSTNFKHDIVNNAFIYGPSSDGNTWFQIDKNQSIYYSGNILDSDKDGVLDSVPTTPYWYQGTGTVLNSPWSKLTSSGPILPTRAAFRLVTSQSGALPYDPMDSLIWSQVASLGTQGTIYSSQTGTGLDSNGYGAIAGGSDSLDSDNDGMPNYWEKALGLDTAKNDAMAIGKSGYANIEDYLNWLGAPHATVPQNGSVDIDLVSFTKGFLPVSPSYSSAAVSGGTATLLANGHTVRFVPTAGTKGLAAFRYGVTGNDGTSFTDTVSVLVRAGASAITTVVSAAPVATSALMHITWFATDGRLLREESQRLDPGARPAIPAGLHGILLARLKAEGRAPQTLHIANP